jgi:hypothetical protein
MKSTKLTLTLTSLLAAAITAMTAGCGGGNQGVACTEEARSSVTVTVKDAAGAAVTDATVKYTVDGGEERACDAPFAGSTDYVCGYEVDGKFEITATRGAETGTASVTVTSDECHVIGQKVTITLAPAP